MTFEELVNAVRDSYLSCFVEAEDREETKEEVLGMFQSCTTNRDLLTLLDSLGFNSDYERLEFILDSIIETPKWYVAGVNRCGVFQAPNKETARKLFRAYFQVLPWIVRPATDDEIKLHEVIDKVSDR